jgi:hypothetical protein
MNREKSLLMLELIFLLTFIILIIIDTISIYKTINLVINSEKTLGEVISIKRTAGRHADAVSITIQYQVNNQNFAYSQTKFFSLPQKKDKVMVCYNKNNPEIAKGCSLSYMWGTPIILSILTIISFLFTILLDYNKKLAKNKDYKLDKNYL